MARTDPRGDNDASARLVVEARPVLRNANDVKRDTKTGKLMDQKVDGKAYNGVRKKK